MATKDGVTSGCRTATSGLSYRTRGGAAGATVVRPGIGRRIED